METGKNVGLQELLQKGRHVEIITDRTVAPIIHEFIRKSLRSTAAISSTEESTLLMDGRDSASSASPGAAILGLAAFNAFLQINVTGPVLESVHLAEALFSEVYTSLRTSPEQADEANTSPPPSLRSVFLASLDIDGVSVYSHIPGIELFCLARWIFSSYLAGMGDCDKLLGSEQVADPAYGRLAWIQLRVHVWHYKLLMLPSLGPGSVLNKSSQWTDTPNLQGLIEKLLHRIEKDVVGDCSESSASQWGRKERVRFLLETANIYIILGMDTKAKEAVKSATELNRFTYALSGALGKRTRFQEKSTSQLVVLAKSMTEEEEMATQSVPQALPLNDDTLLEDLEFSKEGASGSEGATTLPAILQGLAPDEQPQISPLDQIALLTEATLKDAFSPADSLTSEEILPYAVRVISDKSKNWQIYTQALLVRSRIEVHRSRTVERGVLQMQAVVDQVIVATTAAGGKADSHKASTDETSSGRNIPAIEVSSPEVSISGQAAKKEETPVSFFPAPKASESAPPEVRLEYIHALSSPPRWHLESELAYAWAGVGSLVSALEIFKRLRLWAEVALCLASSAAADDEDGRGSGGEEKARAVLRWRLFHRANTSGHDQTVAGTEREEEEGTTDILELRAADFAGPERAPSPANAPRLFCILGDIESEPRHYERAWELSNHRFARAQKSLGEHFLQQKEWESARVAYEKAAEVNRLSPELWSRLGDINLRLGEFAGAADAFRRAIEAASDVAGGEDARTWSNLGSALYSLYLEAVEEKEKGVGALQGEEGEEDEAEAENQASEGEDVSSQNEAASKKSPATLLAQSLAAYKRGSSIARGNWRIWDNIITLASRMRPPAITDIVLALHSVISIRGSEGALDVDILRLLVTEGLLPNPKPAKGEPPGRGTPAKAICDLIEEDVIPLITTRSELWEVVARERLWRSDLTGAVDASEKAWRAAMGGAGGGSLGSTTATGGEDRGNWLVDKGAWEVVVRRTDELVSLLENYGPEVESIGSKWKGKARSAVRSVMSKGREGWEGSEEWRTLENLMDGLR